MVQINTSGCSTVYVMLWHCTGEGDCAYGSCDQCDECISVGDYILCNTTPSDITNLYLSAGGSSGGGGGGGAGTNNSNEDEIATSPILINLNNENPLPKTPCSELAKISANAAEKAALQYLTTKTGEDSEYGYYITKNNITGNHNTPVTAYSSNVNSNQIAMPTGVINLIGIFHTHDLDEINNTVPMFSDGDLYSLFQIAHYHDNNGQPKDYSEYFLTLTVPEGTFAIKIKDPLKFYNFFNNGKWKDGSLYELRKKYDNRQATANIEYFQKDLLTLFNEMNAGIGLYEADPGFNSWQELVLNSDNPDGNPIKQPCN